MRKIVVSIQNGLLAEALTGMLKMSGEFEPYRAIVDRKKRTVPACMACSPDIVLMEVSQAAGATVEERMDEVHQLRDLVPGCKIVFLCDENISSEIARNVVALLWALLKLHLAPPVAFWPTSGKRFSAATRSLPTFW